MYAEIDATVATIIKMVCNQPIPPDVRLALPQRLPESELIWTSDPPEVGLFAEALRRLLITRWREAMAQVGLGHLYIIIGPGEFMDSSVKQAAERAGIEQDALDRATSGTLWIQLGLVMGKFGHDQWFTYVFVSELSCDAMCPCESAAIISR